MLENSPFNDEWNKLQKSFWGNVGSKFSENPNFQSEGNSTSPAQYDPLFDQWLKDVDKCWHDHAQGISGDIDSLYKKLSSSSRFFFNFSESIFSTNQDKTADNLVSNYLEVISSQSREDTEGSAERNNSPFDINAFWKLPLENWQQQAALFSTQQQSLSTISEFLADAANNPEFSEALEAYLVALQKYQMLFFNLFTTAAKEVVDVLQSNNDKSVPLSFSPSQIMTTWLEVFEKGYMALIAGTEYSQAYADVINSWMLMLNKSNKSYAEFMQSVTSTSSGQV